MTKYNKIITIIALICLTACDQAGGSNTDQGQVTQFATAVEAMSVSPSGQYCETVVTVPTSRGRGNGVKAETKTYYEPAYLRGDIDFDGDVDRDDAKLATQKIYKKAFETECPAVFDIGGSPQTSEPDGFLTSQDIFLFNQFKNNFEIDFTVDNICASKCDDVIDHMSPDFK